MRAWVRADAATAWAGRRWRCKAVGLDPALKRPVGQYSQGMRQRTSLARVIQSDPELLLLDEPFSNLDVESAQAMVRLLADFRTWPVYGHGQARQAGSDLDNAPGASGGADRGW